MSEPDFDRLGHQTLWPAEAWREAWQIIHPHRELWDPVLRMVAAGAFGPHAAAMMLRKSVERIHDDEGDA